MRKKNELTCLNAALLVNICSVSFILEKTLIIKRSFEPFCKVLKNIAANLLGGKNNITFFAEKSDTNLRSYVFCPIIRF